jgi:geranylgeranyl diphosphate synthase type II
MAPAATKSTVSDFRATLEEYGALTRAALQEWLPKEEPKRYLYDLVADYPARGGKMLRPCLCLATAVAFGANRQDALRAAVSIELLHNALLVHDDIQDESDERRGQPTLHAIHGVPLAINAGDAMGFFSLRPLLQNSLRLGSRLTLRILEEADRMAQESAEGQALELGWQRDNAMDLDDGDYLEMVLKKTCWLTSIYPLRIGALIGTRRAHLDLAPFLRFGFYLGAAFQIQDDVLNLIGDDRYGKEINGDILEGKRSLMLLHLLREARPALRKQLETFLAKPREKRAAAEVSRIRSAMERYGSIAYAQEIARGLADAARHEFDHAFQHVPDTRDRRFIEALIRYVIERET